MLRTFSEAVSFIEMLELGIFGYRYDKDSHYLLCFERQLGSDDIANVLCRYLVIIFFSMRFIERIGNLFYRGHGYTGSV